MKTTILCGLRMNVRGQYELTKQAGDITAVESFQPADRIHGDVGNAVR